MRSEVEPSTPPGALDAPERLLAALDAASSPREVRLIFERAEALIEIAKRARLADEDLRGFLIASLRAQRRGGEMLAAIPRARSGGHVGKLPTIADLLGQPLHIARHIADNWRAVAAVPEHLFDEYVNRTSGPPPSRAGLVRYHQPRTRHPSSPPPGARPRHPHPAYGELPPDRLRIVPDPVDVEGDLARQHKAEAWQECVEWFARQRGTWRVADLCLQTAEAMNPYAADMATRRPPGTPG